jgi:hypothetical protein
MVVTYAGTWPYDPEIELRNFRQKQAEFEAAYRATFDPQVLFHALLNARGYLQFPTELNWLVTALGDCIGKNRKKGKRKGRASQTIERDRDRRRHVQRYLCVEDLRQKGATKDQALDLAATTLETVRSTIEDSYKRVSGDLNRKKRKSEYFLLVAQSKPTVVPVSVAPTSDGTIINRVLVARRPQG